MLAKSLLQGIMRHVLRYRKLEVQNVIVVEDLMDMQLFAFYKAVETYEVRPDDQSGVLGEILRVWRV